MRKHAKKESERAERTQALQAMQPVRSKKEVDGLMQLPGGSEILRKHFKDLLAQEDKESPG
jgi:hypothetical protein